MVALVTKLVEASNQVRVGVQLRENAEETLKRERLNIFARVLKWNLLA
jgi:hypothetical protein